MKIYRPCPEPSLEPPETRETICRQCYDNPAGDYQNDHKEPICDDCFEDMVNDFRKEHRRCTA